MNLVPFQDRISNTGMDDDREDVAKGLFSSKEAAHKTMQALWEVWKCRPLETSCSDALYLDVFTASCGTKDTLLLRGLETTYFRYNYYYS